MADDDIPMVIYLSRAEATAIVRAMAVAVQNPGAVAMWSVSREDATKLVWEAAMNPGASRAVLELGPLATALAEL